MLHLGAGRLVSACHPPNCLPGKCRVPGAWWDTWQSGGLAPRKLLLPGLRFKGVWCMYIYVLSSGFSGEICTCVLCARISLSFPPSLGQLALQCPRRAGFLTTTLLQLLEDLSLMCCGSLSRTIPSSGTLGRRFLGQLHCYRETGEWLSPVGSAWKVLPNGLTVPREPPPTQVARTLQSIHPSAVRLSWGGAGFPSEAHASLLGSGHREVWAGGSRRLCLAHPGPMNLVRPRCPPPPLSGAGPS